MRLIRTRGRGPNGKNTRESMLLFFTYVRLVIAMLFDIKQFGGLQCDCYVI
jgi:hypothetical protein